MELSYSQKRLWFIDQVDKGSSQYNLSTTIKVEGLLDLEAFNRSFKNIIVRHQVLRTIYKPNGQNAEAFVTDPGMFRIDFVDASEMDRHSLDDLIRKQATKAFDLSKDYMLRVNLYRLAAENTHLVVLTMHHIASDAWSIKLLIKEFNLLYASEISGAAVAHALPDLQIQYGGYVEWQKREMQGESFEKQIRYWSDQLRGVPPLHTLPLDFVRPARQTFEGDRYSHQIDKTLLDKLRRLAKFQRVTLFHVMQSAFSILLARWSQDQDVVMGVPVLGRNTRELQDIIGLFINTLVFRSRVDESVCFSDYVRQVRNVSLEAMENQDVPFEILAQRINPPRSLSHSPIFQIMFSWIEKPTERISAPGLHITLKKTDIGRAKVDLEMEFVESSQGLKVSWVYATSLFKPETIKRMADYFDSLLQLLVDNPESRIRDLNLLIDSDRRQLQSWNQSDVGFSSLDTLPQMLERALDSGPKRTALICNGKEYSYEWLHNQANALGKRIIKQVEVQPGDLVGVLADRSLETVVALLAVVKVGAAFIPFDIAMPQARLRTMLAASNVKTLLVQGESYPTFFDDVPMCIAIPPMEDCNCCEDGVDLGQLKRMMEKVASSLPAYGIFTSGSTGVPKATLNSHAGICNRLMTLQYQFNLTHQDKLLHKTPLSFDVSVGEIFWPLTHGATLVIAKANEHRDPNVLMRLIYEHKVSVIHFVPSMLKMFLKVVDSRYLDSIRVLMTSGESLTYDLQKKAIEKLPNAHKANQYGPAEAAIDVSYWCFDQLRADKKVPIGRPSANTKLFILDESRKLLPIGVEGELYIAGIQVGMGYLGDDQLSADRFFEADIEGLSLRLYRTGDRARWLDDGNIEFLGRRDGQVKLRGMRIDLGEIEARIREIPEVDDTLVLVSGQEENQKLIAYCVLKESYLRETTQERLSGYMQRLSEALPQHMVPGEYVALDAFPLTNNGKIDRKKLPEPAKPAVAARQRPSSEIEHQIRDIWAQELNVSQEMIGVNDSYFEVGGNSLSIIPICSLINQQLQVQLAVADLFHYPSIAQLAIFIDKTKNPGNQQIVRDKVKRRTLDAKGRTKKLRHSKIRK